jgi:aryl-alcohol dehydrogenase-like predicted oxidoreductase
MENAISSSETTFVIGGDIEVRRLGFGAMRITGPGTLGPPQDRAAALALLRRAVELGVQLIDTADAYGPGVSEELIAEALSPTTAFSPRPRAVSNAPGPAAGPPVAS